MRNILLLGLAALALTACGSSKIDLTGSKDVNSAIEAATGPLQDLNLRQQEIPQILVDATANPYAHTKGMKCDDFRSEVAKFDELLGPDMQASNITYASANETLIDHMKNTKDDIVDSVSGDTGEGHSGIEIPDRETVMDTAGEAMRDGVLGFIHGQTNILPFRSIIRRISGANSHQKKLATAYEAGKLRRAYLKGLAEERYGPQCLATPIMVQATPAAMEAKAEVTPSTMPMGIQH